MQKIIKTDKIKNKIIFNMASTLSISLAVYIGIAPIIAYYFNIISPIAIIATLVIIHNDRKIGSRLSQEGKPCAKYPPPRNVRLAMYFGARPIQIQRIARKIMGRSIHPDVFTRITLHCPVSPALFKFLRGLPKNTAP